MTTQESTRRPSPVTILINNITSLALVAIVAVAIYLAWPMLVARFTGGVLPIAPTPEPATVATPRPYQAPASVPRPAEQAPAAPIVQPTPYTLATAEAISNAAYQEAIQQAELNAAPLPNDSKIVEQAPDAPVNADWCRGSHLSRPECQPGNSSKVEK